MDMTSPEEKLQEWRKERSAYVGGICECMDFDIYYLAIREEVKSRIYFLTRHWKYCPWCGEKLKRSDV